MPNEQIPVEQIRAYVLYRMNTPGAYTVSLLTLKDKTQKLVHVTGYKLDKCGLSIEAQEASGLNDETEFFHGLSEELTYIEAGEHFVLGKVNFDRIESIEDSTTHANQN